MNYDALTPLDQFGFLAVNGRDAVKFLQGYTTCDLEQLDTEHAQRGAICNIKGRMVSNFLVISTADGLLLRMDKALVESTEAFLGKYIVFSKAELVNLSGDMVCFGAFGDALAETGDTIPQDMYSIADNDEGKLLKVDENRFELWAAAGQLNNNVQASTAALAAWQLAELRSGIVWVNADTSEEYIPQMFDLHNQAGISFDKGCYLGQEIVARMQYRGELKNRLHLAEVPDSVPAEHRQIGAKVLSSEGKKLGNIVARSGNLCALVLKIGEADYQLGDGTEITPSEVSNT
jgi:hypothetical protein